MLHADLYFAVLTVALVIFKVFVKFWLAYRCYYCGVMWCLADLMIEIRKKNLASKCFKFSQKSIRQNIFYTSVRKPKIIFDGVHCR